jgi:cytochrome c-type biogenesis protein
MELEALLAASPLLALAAAFFAGVASSASPCAIAAVPLVVGYVGGYAGDDRRRAFYYSSAFVFGMALSFTAAGVAVAATGAYLGAASLWWQGLMALLAIFFGGHLLGIWTLPGLGCGACSTTTTVGWRGAGAWGAASAGALAGVAFAPCATPVLAGILAIVGSQADIAFGTTLMFLYAIGHGALLLAAGSSVSLAQRLARSRLARAGEIVLKLAGTLLLGYGAYLVWTLVQPSAFNH